MNGDTRSDTDALSAACARCSRCSSCSDLLEAVGSMVVVIGRAASRPRSASVGKIGPFSGTDQFITGRWLLAQRSGPACAAIS